MSRLEVALRRAAEDLSNLGQRFAVVGGLAVSARTEPRFTRDVDLVVSVTGDAEAEALVRALRHRGYAVVMTTEQEATGRLATVRVASPSEDPEGVVIDLLFASSGIEPELVSEAEPLEIVPGLVVPVATRAHLLALKVLARDDATRPQDAIDGRALLRETTDSELAIVRNLLDLMSARGFNRGKDLQRELTALATSSRGSV